MMPKRDRNPHADSVRRRKMNQRRQAGKASAPPVPTPDLGGEVRLNRFIAQAGMCSRRTADEWIKAGRVRVNGQIVAELGTRIRPDEDLVEVNGQPVRPQSLTYVLLNKPNDAITTTEDERGRRTVMDLLDEPTRKRGVVPVGRLDRGTTGVLVLTNDGDLAHRLMHPSYEVEKLYVVEVDRPVHPDALERLSTGVNLEDGLAKADQVATMEAPRRVAVGLHEGRNRQVRRMFEALGYEVQKLDRVRYAGLTADGLRRGAWRPLEPHEINRLRRLVRLKPLVF
jgi:23S rRNA pseudouridine2605 synthase